MTRRRKHQVHHPIRHLLLLIAVIVVLLAIQPLLWTWLSFSASRLHEKRTETEQLTSIQEQLVAIEASQNEREDQLSLLDTIFPDDASASGPVERLESLANQTNVRLNINSIVERPGTAAGEKLPGLTPLKLTIQVAGEPVQLLRYLELIEHTPELATIESWSVRAVTSGETGEVIVQYRLSAEVVFYSRAQ